MRTVFISGGAGFIGSHLTRQLLARRRSDASSSSTTFTSGTRQHLAGMSPAIRGSRSSWRPQGTRDVTAAMAGLRHRLSSRGESRHRQGRDAAGHRFLGRHLPRAERPRGHARERRAAHSLHVRQRRLWRECGGRVPERLRPVPADLDLRREQAGLRGAHLRLLPHVRHDGARLSFRQRRRPAPDARRRLRFRAPAARPIRRGCASSATARRARATSTSRTSSPRSSSRPRHATGASTSSTSRPTTTSRCARSPTSPCEVSGLPPGSVNYEFTGGDRGWKGDVPIVRFDCIEDQVARLAMPTHSAEAMRDSMAAMRDEIGRCLNPDRADGGRTSHCRPGASPARWSSASSCPRSTRRSPSANSSTGASEGLRRGGRHRADPDRGQLDRRTPEIALAHGGGGAADCRSAGSAAPTSMRFLSFAGNGSSWATRISPTISGSSRPSWSSFAQGAEFVMGSRFRGHDRERRHAARCTATSARRSRRGS